MSSLCQTQAVKLTWYPFRDMRCTWASLRSLSKREHVVDIHLLSSDDHFAHEALDHRLTRFERELLARLPQELPKGVGLVHDLWPMPRLLLSPGALRECLSDVLPCGRHVPPSTLSCIQADDRGLLGIEEALMLPLATRPPLEQWPRRCGEC